LFRVGVAIDDYRGTGSFINDVRQFKYFPVLGGNTDLGPTASLEFALSKRSGSAIDTTGLRLDMFTPVPEDRTKGFIPLERMAEHRPPTNNMPVRESKYGVYSTVGDFPNLYHGNAYGFVRHQTLLTNFELKVGGDIPALGRRAQDIIHNNITKSPFFPWDQAHGNEWYLELSGTLRGSLQGR
jgi:hypothetical protein